MDEAGFNTATVSFATAMGTLVTDPVKTPAAARSVFAACLQKLDAVGAVAEFGKQHAGSRWDLTAGTLGQATKIQTALTTAVDLVGTQRHLWVSLLGLAIAVGSSNGVTSLGTDLRDLISLLAAAAVAAYPGPGVQECNIPAAVDKLKSGTVAQRAFLSAARGHVQDSAATSVPYPLGSAPDAAITTTVVVAGLLATRDVVMLRLGVPKADAGKPGGDTLVGPVRESVAFGALKRYYSSSDPKAIAFLDAAVEVLRDIKAVLYRLHPALVLASAHPTTSEAGGAAAVEGSDPANSPSEAEDGA